MLVTIFHTITSITAFSVMKKLKKSRAELRQHYSVKMESQVESGKVLP
jgi:hypothetical protein